MVLVSAVIISSVCMVHILSLKSLVRKQYARIQLKSLENMCGYMISFVHSFVRSYVRSLAHSPSENSVNHYYLCIYCFAYKNEIVAIVVHLVLNITFFLLGNRIAIIHLKCFIFRKDEHIDDRKRKNTTRHITVVAALRRRKITRKTDVNTATDI